MRDIGDSTVFFPSPTGNVGHFNSEDFLGGKREGGREGENLANELRRSGP